MQIHRGFQNRERSRGGWVAIGNFDGVHRGHQCMLAKLVAKARAANEPAIVLTFEPHPIKLLRPEHAPPALSFLEHKLELFEQHGVDVTIVYPTDMPFLRQTPDEFFHSIVLGELQASGLVEGPNFCFGRNRAGNVETLRSLCAAASTPLEVVSPVIVRGRMVSSSEVRSLIADGRIAEAVEMLGHPYRIRGIVGGGAERGRAIGFPTANLENIETLLPCDGVYAGRCSVAGQSRPAAINIGPNPTFGEAARKFEVHLLDFHGDLYGRSLDIDLLSRVREVVKFASLDELKQQLERDIAVVRAQAQSPS